MNLKKIREVIYHYGEEDKIKALLYHSKEPLLIKIKDFTDKFSLDYFAASIKATTQYTAFEDNHAPTYHRDDFATVLSHIINNRPYRIFGHYLTRQQSAEIESHVPLWQTIPLRPRFLAEFFKVTYFFGGKGSHTAMHFDREHCCNLHLCLSGTKQLLLFTKDQSDNLYKLPFIGDTLVDFSEPINLLSQLFPRLNQAEGYDVILEKGDMLFMPRNCWHFTRYLGASSAATYVFYPHKLLHIYGFFTGCFFLGYNHHTGFALFKKPIIRKIEQHYALATGKTKLIFKCIEAISYLFLLPLVSIFYIISDKIRPRRIINGISS